MAKPRLSYDEATAITMGSGALATGVTGRAPTRAGGGGGGNTSFLDRLKQVGTTALNATSVPQAIAFTTAGKLMGRDLSFKNFGGYFYDNYKGSASTLGIDNPYLSLTADVVFDPTWLLALVPGAGQGYAAAKIAQTGSKFAKGRKAFLGSKAAREYAERAAGPLVSAEKFGKEFGREFVGAADDVQRMKLEKIPEVLGKFKDAQGELLRAADEGVIPALRLGTKKNNIEIALWHKPIRAGRAWQARGNALQLSKLAQTAYKGLNLAENMTAHEDRVLRKLFETMGKTTDEAVTDRAYIGLALIARGKSEKTADDLIDKFRKMKVWDDTHSTVYARSVDEIERATQIAGRMTAKQQAEFFREAGVEIADKLSHLERGYFARSQNKMAEVAGIQERLGRELDKLREMKRTAKTPERLKAINQQIAKVQKDASATILDKIMTSKKMGEVPKGTREAIVNKAMGEITQRLKDMGYVGGIGDITRHPNLTEKFASFGEGAEVPRNLAALADEIEKLNYAAPLKIGVSAASSKRVADALRQAKKLGMATPPRRLGSQLSDAAALARKNDWSPFEELGAMKFMDSLDDFGVPPQLKDEITEFFTENFKFHEDPSNVMTWKAGRDFNIRPPLTPEFDALTLVGEGSKAAWDRAVRNTIEEMIKENGLNSVRAVDGVNKDLAAVADASDDAAIKRMVDDIFKENIGYDDISLLGMGPEKMTLGKVIGWTKLWFTVMNPAHFFTNAWGGFVNGLIRGNWRHLGNLKASVPSRRLNQYWRMGRAGEDVAPGYWQQVNKIGDNEYTNADLMLMAQMSGLGLGHGQVRQEIEMMIHLLDPNQKPGNVLKRYARMMQKSNITRENADRIGHWVSRLRAGEDPITAGAHTVRSYFDYNALTAFEKTWLRNLIFFYTWMRKNTAYQATSILARPGMYSAMWDIEQKRRESADPNEPDWVKKTFGFWLPGLAGPIGYSSPMGDIFKMDFTQDDFRRNYLSSLNPFIQAPIEFGLNRDTFTGADVDRLEYADQNVPSVLGRIPGLGGMVRKNASAPLEPGAPPQLVNLYNAFSGPWGNTIDKVTAADPYNERENIYDILARATGLRYEQPEPIKWARSEYYKRIRQKADRTSAYNLSH